MKNKLKVLVPLVLILSLNLIGCGINSEKKSKENIKNTSKVETYDLIKYKGTYVGDNSSVGSIIKIYLLMNIVLDLAYKLLKSPMK